MKKIITIFTVFGILFYSGVKPVIAAVTDYRIVTWNLQGSSAASESKWNINVRQLVSGSDGADILMIQEAGSLPLTAVQTPRQVQPVGIGIPINEYTWNNTTTGYTIYILFPGGCRCKPGQSCYSVQATG